MGGKEMIEVRKDGERIKISFPYNPDYITRIKTIGGYRWRPEGCICEPCSDIPPNWKDI
jgi:hypothetical protein